jgi:hypothetical protein
MYFNLQGALFASGVAADVCLSSLILRRNNVKERGATTYSEDTTVTKAVILSIPYKAAANAEVISSSILSLQPFEALKKAVADVTARKVVHDMDLAMRKALSVSWTKIPYFISTGRQRLFAVTSFVQPVRPCIGRFRNVERKGRCSFCFILLAPFRM